jgi:HK97 family phage portal protein
MRSDPFLGKRNDILRRQRAYRGKADPGDDPRTSGGWAILEGALNSGLWTGASEIWDKRVTDLEGIPSRQSIVFACLTRLCNTVTEAPPRIGLDTAEGWKDLPDHPVNALLRRPNRDMPYALFIWHVVAHLKLRGESYVWKWRNNGGEVAELWPVPTGWVTPRRDQAGSLFYEVYQGPNREKKNVLAEDMIRLLLPDPKDLTRGLGPLQAALKEVQTDDERCDYTMEMLVNVKSPGIVVSKLDTWETEEKEEARARLNQGLGRGKRGEPLFVGGEGVKAEFPAPLKDLDWKGLANLTESRICSAFEVPPILIGLRVGLESATYSNYELAEKAFYRGPMSSLWNKLDGDLTKGLLIDEDYGEDGAEIYHDTSNVKALDEDADKKATRAAALFAGSLATRNEAREVAGMDKLETGGDVFLVPINMQEVPADQLGIRPDLPPKDTGQALQE